MLDHILTNKLRWGVLSLMLLSHPGVAENLTSEPSAEFLSDQTYPDQTIRQIAFGSCNKPKREQGFWEVIRAKEPDLMLLLGDNHYGNTSDPVRMKKAYQELAAIPEYKALRREVATLATWDNHDYGAKYPGRLHPHAEEAEELFLDHFAIPEEDIRRSRKGIYGTWIFGEKPHRVQVILLDLQRFRDPFRDGPKKEQFAPQKGKTLMGVEQWKWLEEQLAKEAEVRIVGSGIQVLSNEHSWRRWGMFPDDREKLLRVIGEATGTTVLLSGDRHRGEISVLNPEGERPLFDVTASSFNHCYPAEEENRLRVGQLIDEPHFGWLEINWKESLIEIQLLSSENGDSFLSNTLKIGSLK